jgi:hypothetical protein
LLRVASTETVASPVVQTLVEPMPIQRATTTVETSSSSEVLTEVPEVPSDPPLEGESPRGSAGTQRRKVGRP